METQEDEYASPYTSFDIPVWVWGLIMGLIFLLVTIGLYYATSSPSTRPPSLDKI